MRRIFTGWNDFVSAGKIFDEILIYDIYAARERLEDFDFSRFGVQATNINELGNEFARACGGRYTDQFPDIVSFLDSQGSDTIVVLFTAGDLDYLLRSSYSFLSS